MLGAGAQQQQAGAPSRGVVMMAVTVRTELEVDSCSMM